MIRVSHKCEVILIGYWEAPDIKGLDRDFVLRKLVRQHEALPGRWFAAHPEWTCRNLDQAEVQAGRRIQIGGHPKADIDVASAG